MNRPGLFLGKKDAVDSCYKVAPKIIIMLSSFYFIIGKKDAVGTYH